MPRGSPWMMLIGGIVLLVGVVFAGWLWPSSLVTRTVAPGESTVTDLSVEAGNWVSVAISVHDHGRGVELSVHIQPPPGVGGPRVRSTTLLGRVPILTEEIARGTGTYTIVIQNTGEQTVTIDYRVTTFSETERHLNSWGVPLVITGFFILVVGLGLRFIWEGRRRYGWD